MKKQLIDLHIHSKCSDGVLSVKELLEKAEQTGLSFISITDHNTVSAYYDITEYRKFFSKKIITGVELSTTYKGELIEILGYGFDVTQIKKFICENYLGFAEKTLAERMLILTQYTKKGVVMSDEFCYNMEHNPTMYYQPDKESCRTAFLNEIKSHPENSKFFGGQKEMDTATIREFFRGHYSRPSSMLYVDVSSLFPHIDEVITAIHNAGGLAFLAHGFLYSKCITDKLELLASNYNFDGFECYHSFFTKEQSEYLLELCDKNNMYKSGGSDFHGGTRTDCIMGKSTGGISLDSSLINDWLKGINNYV